MPSTGAVTIRSRFVTAGDGLKLHVRLHEPARPAGLPVVCLPGLTRTTADFDVLAEALAANPKGPHRVIALDSRGRGLSGYDADPANYNVATELTDLLTVLAALAIERAIFIGTSRGGILTMLLAAVNKAPVAAAVLNDIGPVIELEGLLRIKGYVGRMPAPRDYDDAARIMRTTMGSQFPRLTGADWLASARRAFKIENGRLVPTYDVRLAEGLKAIEPGQPQPALWDQFNALAGTPLMVIRGALTDVLSEATVDAMAAAHPGLEVIHVPDEGHAPLLADAPTLARIEAFIEKVETADL
jgi:pimeloyl-ACP methyl ester carboxylesterase